MISDKAKQLILSFEGVDQPNQWPGGDSGITIGIGYDLGYESLPNFVKDWGAWLTDSQLHRLSNVCGLTGIKAATKAKFLSDIHISRDVSRHVFESSTIPRYELMTRNAFPGFDNLPLDAQGALVSLVYNRGTKMDGDSRSEMRAIRDAVATGNLPDIVTQFRAMKRLWVGKGLDGLLRRRDAEADLVASCIESS